MNTPPTAFPTSDRELITQVVAALLGALPAPFAVTIQPAAGQPISFALAESAEGLTRAAFYSDLERSIVLAVGEEVLQGKQIAARLDLEHGASLKLKLANLVERGVLRSITAHGYRVTDRRFVELAQMGGPDR